MKKLIEKIKSWFRKDKTPSESIEPVNNENFYEPVVYLMFDDIWSIKFIGDDDIIPKSMGVIGNVPGDDIKDIITITEQFNPKELNIKEDTIILISTERLDFNIPTFINIVKKLKKRYPVIPVLWDYDDYNAVSKAKIMLGCEELLNLSLCTEEDYMNLEARKIIADKHRRAFYHNKEEECLFRYIDAVILNENMKSIDEERYRLFRCYYGLSNEKILLVAKSALKIENGFVVLPKEVFSKNVRELLDDGILKIDTKFNSEFVQTKYLQLTVCCNVASKLHDPEYLFLESTGKNKSDKKKNSITFIQGHVDMEDERLLDEDLLTVLLSNMIKEIGEEIKPILNEQDDISKIVKALNYTGIFIYDGDSDVARKHLGIVFKSVSDADLTNIVSKEPKKHSVIIIPQEDVYLHYHNLHYSVIKYFRKRFSGKSI